MKIIIGILWTLLVVSIIAKILDDRSATKAETGAIILGAIMLVVLCLLEVVG